MDIMEQGLSRRTFTAGFGLMAVGLSFDIYAAPKSKGLPTSWPAMPPTGFRPNVFLHIAPDGLVTIVCHRSEMGQGVRSSLHVVIADELGADLPRVKVVQGDGDKAYGDQDTDGSSSIRARYEDLRYFGGTARTMLTMVAAKRWKAPMGECEAKGHAVVHVPTGRTLGFGDLAAEAARLPVVARNDVVLKPRAQLRYIGKDLPLLDGPDIVLGQARFGADITLPGMLTAVILRPPVVGGAVASLDAAAALRIPGVKKIVQLPPAKAPWGFQPLGGVAVIAANTWAAMKGREALRVTWHHGDNAAYNSDAYRETLTQSVNQPGKVVRKKGDVDKALAKAKQRVEATYHTPHLAHVSMEPPVAVARIAHGKCEIWAPTQNPQSAREEAAKALGMKENDVTVHVTLLGGGFGRKSKSDFVTEAALLAKDAGVPVRVQWTREDDVQHDYYHSASAQKLVAGLDGQGQVVAWQQRIAFPSISTLFSATNYAGASELGQGITDLPLAIPNVTFENCEARAMTRIGWMRSVANVYHAFAVQSFMDEIAVARQKDPRDNLLEMIGPPRIVTPAELGVEKVGNYNTPLSEHPIDTARLRHVIERVTALAGWDDRKKDKRALGLAAHRSFLSYVAAVVAVSRDETGRLKVDEIWMVADAGTIVNRERVHSQFEGAAIFGLSIGLYGAVTMKDGATEQSNFHDFKLVRLADAPRKTTVEVVASDGRPCGVGEPGVPPVAPALANAVFALTGTRVRELPIARWMPC